MSLAGEPESRFSFKSLALSLALSGLGLGLVIFLTADERTWEGLRRLSPAFLSLGLGVVLALWIVEGQRTRTILAMMGYELGLARAMRVNLASGFVGGITPFTSGGPPTLVYLLYRLGVPVNKGMAVAATRSLLTLLFFAVFVPFILMAFRSQVNLPSGVNILVYVAVASTIAAISAFLYILGRPGVVERAAAWMVSTPALRWLLRSHDPRATAGRASQEARRFGRSLHLVFGTGNLRGTIMLALYTLASWALFFSLGPVILEGLGLSVPLVKVLTRQVVLFFIVSYTPLPGGSGMAELGLASVFSPLIPSHLLPIFVGGWRFLTYHSTLLAGSLSLAITR
ncbi:MAG: lysylphosphatidylglycerol synthase transmembrane domain-containing protein [Bacillota bacterium]